MLFLSAFGVVLIAFSLFSFAASLKLGAVLFRRPDLRWQTAWLVGCVSVVPGEVSSSLGHSDTAFGVPSGVATALQLMIGIGSWVIAVGGEAIKIEGKRVFINGKPLDDPWGKYVDSQVIPRSGGEEAKRDNFGPLIEPPGTYFVMGDNRDRSYDSRFWGSVRRDDVKGKASILYWSEDREAKGVRWQRIGKRKEDLIPEKKG